MKHKFRLSFNYLLIIPIVTLIFGLKLDYQISNSLILQKNDYRAIDHGKYLAFITTNALKKKAPNCIKSRIVNYQFLLNGIFNKKFFSKITRLLEHLESGNNENEYITGIKKSGYFSLLQIHTNKISKKETSKVFILPNNLLKKVYVHNKSEKLIPSKFLAKLFKPQIGYPKNFIQLRLALSIIMKWYSDKGYQWALVQVQHALDPSSIIINIHEGLIQTIKAEYYSHAFEKLSDDLYTQTLEEYLGIQVGLPINIRSLQRRINYLKSNKLVGNIIYSIERSQYDLNNVDIIFQVQELRDKELLIAVDYLSENSFIASKLAYSFKKYLSLSTYRATTALMQQSATNTQFYNVHNVLNYQYNNSRELINLLTCTFYKQIAEINNQSKLHILSDLTKEASIGLKIYRRNLNKSNSHFRLSTQFIRNILNLKISYFNPAIKFSKNCSIQIMLQIFRKHYFSKESVLSRFLQDNNQSNGELITQYIYDSLFTYSFTSCCLISERILLVNNVQTNPFFQTSEIINFANNAIEIIWKNCASFKQSPKLLYQNFFVLLFSLNYQTYDSLDWPTKGYLLIIQSSYFTIFRNSDFINCVCLSNCKNLFSHRINIKYVSHWKIPFSFTNRINHILVNTIRIRSNLSSETVSVLLYNNHFNGRIYQSLSNFLIKVKTEYYIPLNKNSRISIFFNYLKPFLSTPLNAECLSKLLVTNKKNGRVSVDQLFYGFNLQLKLPINHMPSLSIEYTVNSSRQFCIYLHISH
uniref:POTRA domain-containing protein n=1 Tax=Bangia fuscopurpurea TaxID=101920 RepID=A0A0F6YES5_BANFU|nr:hypothetical protein 621 [Bangia fuscopurpurea]